MAAAPDLGSGAARRGGSSPFIRTKKNRKWLVLSNLRFFLFFILVHSNFPQLFKILRTIIESLEKASEILQMRAD